MAQKKAQTRPVIGALSSRLMQLREEVGIPDPYEIADGLVVYPPTKERGEQMAKASNRLGVLSALLNAAINTSIPRPTLPPRPEHPGHDASPEQLASYADDLTEWRAYMAEAKASYDDQVAAWEASVAKHEAATLKLADQLEAAKEDYERAFFGDTYAAVLEFFRDKERDLWDAFVQDIKRDFLPPQPENGVCPTCGHVDEDQAGKAPESST